MYCAALISASFVFIGHQSVSFAYRVTHSHRHVRKAHFSRGCSQTYGAAGAGAGAGGSGGMAALVVGAWSFVTSSLVPAICLSMKS